MALPSIPEFFRLPSIAVSPIEYFTDASNTINIKSDVVLVVGKDRFYCHRLLLSLVSPVFTRMFEGQFKEHDEREIVLEGKNKRQYIGTVGNTSIHNSMVRLATTTLKIFFNSPMST